MKKTDVLHDFLWTKFPKLLLPSGETFAFIDGFKKEKHALKQSVFFFAT